MCLGRCVVTCVYEFVFGDGSGRLSLGMEEKEECKKIKHLKI